MALKELFTAKMGRSRLMVGYKYETAELVGHTVTFDDVDIVDYIDGEDKRVHYAVYKIREIDSAAANGYYCAGKTLTEIGDEIIGEKQSEDGGLYYKELTNDGITVVLTNNHTRDGRNYTAVAVM